jgi:hypothetical protein
MHKRACEQGETDEVCVLDSALAAPPWLVVPSAHLGRSMRHVGAEDSDDSVAKRPSTIPRHHHVSSRVGSGRRIALGVTTTSATAVAKAWIACVCFGSTSSSAWALGGQYLYTNDNVVKDYTGPASEGNYTLSTDKNRVVEFYSPYCVRETHWLEV